MLSSKGDAVGDVEAGLEQDDAALVGSLMVGGRSPLEAVVAGSGWKALREAASNLERAGALYRQACSSQEQMEGLHRGQPAAEWRRQARAARIRQWSYARIVMDQAALMIASGLGPDPVSDDEVGTGLADVERAAVAWLMTRGLRRLKRGR